MKEWRLGLSVKPYIFSRLKDDVLEIYNSLCWYWLKCNISFKKRNLAFWL